MLNTPTPYPFVGSFALLIDRDRPEGQQELELVRLLRHTAFAGEDAVVSFPLRRGASGTKSIDPTELLDGTPLTKAEERELTDLDLALRGRRIRTANDRRAKDRAEALRGRLCHSPILRDRIEELRRRQATEARAAQRAA